jgi:hypothetical protein
MALEGRDLNDGNILQATRQIGGPNDTVKFSITLPSGREFTSEYFQNDRKREALHAWLPAVRQQVVGDSEEAENEARRAFFEKQALEKRQAAERSQLIVPGPVEYVGPAQNESPTLEPVGSMDALSHARRQVASALQSKGLALAAHVKASETLADAERNLRRWTQVLSVLESPEADPE